MNEQQRIERLERRFRMLTLCLAVLAIVFVAGGLAANQAIAPSKLRATGLEIVDDDGNVRMELRRGDDHAYGVMINNAKGELRTTLFGGDYAQGLNFSPAALPDQPARKRGVMFVARQGEIILGMRTKAGGCVMFVGEDGPHIEMRDADNQAVYSAPPK